MSVIEALKVGFRHIDSAGGYNNRRRAGKGIKAAGVARGGKFFVTTKLFPGFKPVGHRKNYDQTIETCKISSNNFSLTMVTLLIHAPLAELRLEQWGLVGRTKKNGADQAYWSLQL
ncbi:MAG: hypothetical protein IPG32_17810 [Saprospirales bacterium]|nr:hypothetical protein [Saprospirales bacterium]